MRDVLLVALASLGAGGAAAAILVTGAEVGVLALLGLLAVVIALLAPRLWAVLAILAIMAAPTLERFVPSASFIDEAAVAASFVVFTAIRIIRYGRLRTFPGLGWYAVFAFLGVISGVVSGAPTAVVATGAALALKGVILGFAIAQLDIGGREVRRIAKIGAGLAVVLLAIGLINLVMPSAWAGLIGGVTAPSGIPGIDSVFGPFVHPSAWGRVCAVLLVGALAYRITVGRSPANSALVVLLGLGAVLSFRMKSLAAAAVGALYTARSAFNRTGFVLMVGAAIAALLLSIDILDFLFGDRLGSYLSESSARATLTLGGFTVANNHFPFGAGFGRYGSATAAAEYSPEYVALGFPGHYGLGDESLGQKGSFLIDTQWPAVVGEAGWFGLLAFALALFAAHRSFRLTATTGDPVEDRLLAWLPLFGSGVLVVFLIESVAAPVFTSAPAFVFLFGLIGVWQAARGTITDRRRGFTGGHATVAPLSADEPSKA